MQDGFAQFGGAVGVDAAMIGLAFGADDVASAYRAPFRHVERFVAAGMVFVFDYACDFGDHVAAALDFHPVADLYAQALDFVHVVQGGAADCGTADGNRLERGYRREFSRTPDLYQDIFNPGNARPRGVLVGDGPAWCFAGVSQFRL